MQINEKWTKTQKQKFGPFKKVDPELFFKTRDAPKRVALTSRKGIEKLREIQDRGRTFLLAQSALKHS